ncbi:hypothetical protein NMY22_g256 [Coprinellus aureogranulatus]|nr:hypothetical protein NMY22_g256 [Coprinellus aureogranulatus]
MKKIRQKKPAAQGKRAEPSKRHRIDNSRTPIGRLGKEILATIFLSVLDNGRETGFPDYPLPEVAISHVSSDWRVIALSTPFLWTFFRFDATQADRIPCDRLEAYVERSQGHPLDFWAKVTHGMNANIHWMEQIQLLGAIHRHLDHCRRLYFTTNEAELWLVNAGDLEDVEAPLLETFVAPQYSSLDDYDNDQNILSEWSPNTFLGGAPSLKFVSLNESSVILYRPPLDAVVHLRLHIHEDASTLPVRFDATVLDSIFTLPHLKALSIRGPLFKVDPGSVDTPEIVARSLKHFRCDQDTDSVALGEYFLSHVNAPSLKSLTLENLDVKDQPKRLQKHYQSLRTLVLRAPEDGAFIADVFSMVVNIRQLVWVGGGSQGVDTALLSLLAALTESGVLAPEVQEVILDTGLEDPATALGQLQTTFTKLASIRVREGYVAPLEAGCASDRPIQIRDLGVERRVSYDAYWGCPDHWPYNIDARYADWVSAIAERDRAKLQVTAPSQPLATQPQRSTFPSSAKSPMNGEQGVSEVERAAPSRRVAPIDIWAPSIDRSKVVETGWDSPEAHGRHGQLDLNDIDPEPSAIRRLPNEILTTILHSLICGGAVTGIPGRPLPEVAISHVCSHWRALSLLTPSLWTFFCCGSGDESSALTEVSQARIERLQAYLERSQSSALYLWLHLEGPRLLQQFLPVLYPHFCRLATLQLLSEDHHALEAIRWRMEDLQSAPILRTLIARPVTQDWSRPDAFSHWDPTILRAGNGALQVDYLHLDQVSIRYFRPPLGSIVHLLLECDEPRRPPRVVFEFATLEYILRQPLLETLSIIGGFFRKSQVDTPPTSRHVPIQCNALKHFRYIDGSHRLLGFPLAHVSAPALESIAINAIHLLVLNGSIHKTEPFPSLHTIGVYHVGEIGAYISKLFSAGNMTFARNAKRLLLDLPSLAYLAPEAEQAQTQSFLPCVEEVMVQAQYRTNSESEDVGWLIKSLPRLTDLKIAGARGQKQWALDSKLWQGRDVNIVQTDWEGVQHLFYPLWPPGVDWVAANKYSGWGAGAYCELG